MRSASCSGLVRPQVSYTSSSSRRTCGRGRESPAHATAQDHSVPGSPGARQPSWPRSVDAWKPSPTTCSRRCHVLISAPAGSATCAGCCWTAAASRSSRWPPSWARSTTRRCTTSWRPAPGTGGRSATGWPSGWSGRFRRPRGWWTTPAFPRTAPARWGPAAVLGHAGQAGQLPAGGVGRRGHRAGLLPAGLAAVCARALGPGGDGHPPRRLPPAPGHPPPAQVAAGAGHAG